MSDKQGKRVGSGSTEWLDLMLGELRQRRDEADEARAEAERRAGDDGSQGDQAK